MQLTRTPLRIFPRRLKRMYVFERFLNQRSQVPQILEMLTLQLSKKNYSTKEIFAVRLATEESLVNALEHGHQGDPLKRVHVRFLVKQNYVLVKVQDQGVGFQPGDVADPLTPENLENPGGRGILLMKFYMTWVRFSNQGNCVTMCKRRSS